MNFKLNYKRIKSRSRLLIPLTISFLVVGAALPAGAAATLDAKQAKSLTSDRMWQMKLGSGNAYRPWKRERGLQISLLPRIGSRQGPLRGA